MHEKVSCTIDYEACMLTAYNSEVYRHPSDPRCDGGGDLWPGTSPDAQPDRWGGPKRRPRVVAPRSPRQLKPLYSAYCIWRRATPTMPYSLMFAGSAVRKTTGSC